MTLSTRLRAFRAVPLRGFTLVELLVTTSIMALLLALLLPAVQSAREAARQVECKNNLKQLAIACHSHHDVHGFFPTGGWGWFWTGDADRGFGKDQPGGWIYNTLPYFEQYSVYETASDGDPEALTRKQRTGAATIIETPLSIINCPSRRANIAYPLTSNASGASGFFNSLTPNQAGRSDYAANSGHVYNEWYAHHILGRGPQSYQEAKTWSASRYWGVDQAPFDRSLPDQQVMSGISYERSTVATRQITAGMTHVYMIGERFIPADHYETGQHIGDNETWCTGFNNDNYRRTGRLVGREIVENMPVPDTATNIAEDWGRFGSAHAGIWNVAFCDGSVTGMSYDLDWRIHRDSGNRRAD